MLQRLLVFLTEFMSKVLSSFSHLLQVKSETLKLIRLHLLLLQSKQVLRLELGILLHFSSKLLFCARDLLLGRREDKLMFTFHF